MRAARMDVSRDGPDVASPGLTCSSQVSRWDWAGLILFVKLLEGMTVRASVQQVSAGRWKSSRDADQRRKKKKQAEFIKLDNKAQLWWTCFKPDLEKGHFSMIFSVRSTLRPPGFTLPNNWCLSQEGWSSLLLNLQDHSETEVIII